MLGAAPRLYSFLDVGFPGDFLLCCNGMPSEHIAMCNGRLFSIAAQVYCVRRSCVNAGLVDYLTAERPGPRLPGPQCAPQGC